MMNARILFLILALIFTAQNSFALSSGTYYEGQAQWDEFKKFTIAQQEQDEETGMSYMISGAVATVGGAYGFSASEEVFSRSIFAITSSLGIAAIGLGANYYFTGNEVTSFYYAVEHTSLSAAQKNELLRNYLERERKARETRRWIQVATHALIAAVNFYGASQTHDDGAKSVFYFLGGVNTLMAVTYSF
jgi:hypothetical protein